LTAKRSHSQHPATSHSQNPQSKPRKPAVKISLLTAIAGQVSTHNNEIFLMTSQVITRQQKNLARVTAGVRSHYEGPIGFS
jgi:hypothetical protein